LDYVCPAFPEIIHICLSGELVVSGFK